MTTNTTDPKDASLDEFLGVEAGRPWKKWLRWGLIGLALLIAAFIVYRLLNPADTVRYATEKVERGELTVTVSATGNIRPINQVDVGSEQSGLITEVHVDVNDQVKKGQLLALLDPARLQDSVTQARASQAASQASVAQAEATVAEANATLQRQEEVFRLSAGRVPSKTELDTARANRNRALATLNSARAQVVSQQAALSSAETNLSRARIYSPVTGVVLSRDIEPGQTVAASFNAPVLFTIAEDLRQMELQVSIDEADVGEVKEGQDATFTVDAFPGKRFPAHIRRVNVGSNDSSTSSTTTSSTGQVVAYTAVLTVNNEDQTLRPGMTATADIVTTRRANALLVPNAAFRFRPTAAAQGGQQGGITGAIMPRGPRRAASTRTATSGRGAQQSIFILNDAGQPQEVQVTTGDTNGTLTEVLSGGLKEGQMVITGQLSGDAAAAQPARGAPKGGN